MVQTPLRTITLEEFLEQPETKPASEYIDGQIIQKPMPQGRHSIIQGKLSTEIELKLERQSIATAFPELRCTFGDRSTIPDIAVFEHHRIPVNAEDEIENTFAIPPDWTIEILSPGQSPTKVLKNINHCLAYGSQMGWLIDPEEKSVMVIHGGQRLEVIDEPSQVLPVPTFAGEIVLTIADIFSWLKRTPKA
jgi:Uma2 family endonuclease